jgi:glyoxylase-like metal-dependent hydrolase (beta-lactamase superfamily II)
MIVRQIPVGPMQNFVYLVVDEPSRQALVVDSGWETDPIIRLAKNENAKVGYVVATHSHFDHISSIEELAGQLGAQVVAHAMAPIDHDIAVNNDDTLRIGGSQLKVLYTPGHTEDSICLHGGNCLFTGDTLFIGNCGRTDLPGGSAEKLFRSLHEVILKLPAETVIYPGHDYGDVPYRKLGEESILNPALTARNLDEFSNIF